MHRMAGIGQRLADDFGNQRLVLDQQYMDFFGGLVWRFRRHALAGALVQLRADPELRSSAMTGSQAS